MQESIFDILRTRIYEITEGPFAKDAWGAYFREVTSYIADTLRVYELTENGRLHDLELSRKKELHDRLYRYMTSDYEHSYLNPDVAAADFGTGLGRVLSAIYAEITSLTAYAYEAMQDAMELRLELFMELYGVYEECVQEGTYPDATGVTGILSDYAYDYSQNMADLSTHSLYTVHNGVAGRIIEAADLTDTAYLYEYGEYISDNELKMAGYMSGLSYEEIDRIASVFTDGYIRGFEVTGKDIGIKNLVEIRYFIGFERVVRRAVELFKEAGLDSSLRRTEPSFVSGRKLNKTGYRSTIPNRQFEADHENDRLLYFDRRFMEHRLMCYNNALNEHRTGTAGFGGPAVIESFGEKAENLISKGTACTPDDAYNKLVSEYTVKSTDMLNEYVKGEERSFTIIAFPVPAIGKDFAAIFDETVRLNTLDYKLYQDIQQIMIDTLDKVEYVRVLGRGGNQTDLTVRLWQLKDPDKETKFENCVADVNIPVGEVFTSPVLEGTEGILHVGYVYLNEMPFKELKLLLHDGMITEYSCENFESAKDNRTYIKKYLLFSHDTLPIGEFAIGTNTAAYMMTKRYSLESVMPILIAEKTGPHFAMGDTCYSHEEDIMTYNPDGKAIVARENSVSAGRKTDPLKAYYGCHTDITIPYDELGRLYGVTREGREIDIIRDGRFVLAGCEELNKELDNE